jgi:hypothetical protein
VLVGSVERFAIEALPEEFSSGLILGRFRFWVDSQTLGDWEDMADLKGCVAWLRDFATIPRERYDSRLDGMDAAAVFLLLYEPVFGINGLANPVEQPVPYAYERFHISHLGMSSFELVDILLVKSVDGRERCLWRKADGAHIREMIFDKGEMEAVALKFCEDFENAYCSEQRA